MKLKQSRLLLAMTTLLASNALWAVEGHLGAIFGDNPEKRVLAAQAKENQDLLDSGTVRLADRLALLALCTSRNAYRGKDASTLEWYTATALSQWNDEVLSKFPPSSDLSLDASAFRKAFEAAIAKRLQHAKTPSTLSDDTDLISEAVKAFTDSAHEINETLGNSTRSFKRFSPKTLASLRDKLSTAHTLSSLLNADCSDAAKGSKFWSTYNFLGEHKATPAVSTLKKRENIIQKIIPGRKPSASTESLIDVAYGQAHLYRNSDRSVKHSNKSPSTSLGRCAMYVAISLQKAGCTPEFRAPDAKAKYIGRSLKSYGFTNLMKNGQLPSGIDDLFDVPAGAVLVYEGGDAGHVEIRTKNGFVSDYYSSNPRTGSAGSTSARGRKLTGIYVKPSCGAGSMI